MRIEAVTVCINYADFLKEAIPFNLQHLDRWVIVTTPDDTATRELCRRYGLQCVLTKEVYRDGDDMNKGRAIMRGVDMLHSNGWILHLDADIVLPNQFKRYLDAAHLEESKIYGVDRVMCRNAEDWKKLKYSGYLQHDYHCRVNVPPGFELGSRWATDYYGWCPLGFFQLWHGSADLYCGHHSKLYPISHGDAARGDIQHALAWDRRDRVLVSEVIVVHLESEPAKLGANWKGRTTKPFVV